MSMRSQVYEWNGLGATAAQNFTNAQAGNSTSIFIGGFGNNITKPAETTATEFVVIEDIACTPSQFATQLPLVLSLQITVDNLLVSNLQTVSLVQEAYVQVRINTTDYFLDPDNVANDGIPGTASPYPRSLDFQPSFNLYPDVYVLPGQVWDVLYVAYNTNSWGAATGADQYAFTKYTLYDGPDALIANKLLEMGISINPAM